MRASNRNAKLMGMPTPGKAGFTLVEIMIVVALVGLLAGIAIPSIVRARTQSQANACINNLRQIDDASQEWALENHKAADATVLFSDIQPYLKSAVICPSAGPGATFANSYITTTVSNKPICKLFPATHLLALDGDPIAVTP
jgi:prepilin-type N-terminal cleavage/methylation domain-containing protein